MLPSDSESCCCGKYSGIYWNFSERAIFCDPPSSPLPKTISSCLDACPQLVLVYIFYFFCHVAFGILVPSPGIKPGAPALRALSPNHWTTREVPILCSFKEHFVYRRSSTGIGGRSLPYVHLFQAQIEGASVAFWGLSW